MLLIRSPKRRRTVALEVQADGSLKVTAPVRTSLAWINDFIAQKAGWIARRQQAVQRALLARPAPLGQGSLIPFQGREVRLVLEKTEQNDPPSCCYNEELGELHLTLHEAMAGAEREAEIRTSLVLWYKKQARSLVQSRLSFWAQVMGLSPSRVILSNPRKRWGSCNAKNEIRINWRIIMAEPRIMDYLLVHELAHIPHKNHGKRFWALVARHVPDAPQLRQKLRAFEKNALFSEDF